MDNQSKHDAAERLWVEVSDALRWDEPRYELALKLIADCAQVVAELAVEAQRRRAA